MIQLNNNKWAWIPEHERHRVPAMGRLVAPRHDEAEVAGPDNQQVGRHAVNHIWNTTFINVTETLNVAAKVTWDTTSYLLFVKYTSTLPYLSTWQIYTLELNIQDTFL